MKETLGFNYFTIFHTKLLPIKNAVKRLAGEIGLYILFLYSLDSKTVINESSDSPRNNLYRSIITKQKMQIRSYWKRRKVQVFKCTFQLNESLKIKSSSYNLTKYVLVYWPWLLIFLFLFQFDVCIHIA